MNTNQSTVAKIRNVLAHHKKMTCKHRSENPTDHYRVDRRDAELYFGILPKTWKYLILDFFEELRERKAKIAYLDVCGRASARKLGADISFLFSYQTFPLTKKLGGEGDVFIDGDIFDSNDFSRMIATVSSYDTSLALAVFRPMAGLESYTPWHSDSEPEDYEKITYTVLAKRLSRVVKQLIPGGYLILERPFQFDNTMRDALRGLSQNEYEISKEIKKIARKLKCRVKIHTEITGPYYLLQKND